MFGLQFLRLKKRVVAVRFVSLIQLFFFFLVSFFIVCADRGVMQGYRLELYLKERKIDSSLVASDELTENAMHKRNGVFFYCS
mgnify:CR=1 FL=1